MKLGSDRCHEVQWTAEIRDREVHLRAVSGHSATATIFAWAVAQAPGRWTIFVDQNGPFFIQKDTAGVFLSAGR